MRLPDFLIIGEMRCGTTTLWDYLRQHPRVFLPPEKELHYFASYRDYDHHGRYGKTPLERYASHFAAARADQRSGEATPSYLFDEGACQRIAHALPDVKLIVILRDPVQRAWSHYWHEVRQLHERLPFQTALAAEDQRLRRGDPDERASFSYVARGRYVNSLMRYAKVFGRDRLCVVLLEELRADNAAAMRPVFAHLGLDPDAAPPQYHLPSKNQAGYPRWPALDALCRRARRWSDACGPLTAVPTNAVASLTRPWRVYRGRPRIPECARANLARVFEPTDRALAAWLGRRLPWRAPTEARSPGTSETTPMDVRETLSAGSTPARQAA